tara:strand:- start:472 stop:915 length:444 start_codon:yes stop_codon:yes gene_type:complete
MYLNNYKTISLFSIFSLVGVFSCVSPPENTDGLLENIPAVMNESDFFSLSILGDSYTENILWDLKFSAEPADLVLSTLVLKDISLKETDSTYFQLINDRGDTIINLKIQTESIISDENMISEIGIPKSAKFIGDNFSGRIEYQLIKK